MRSGDLGAGARFMPERPRRDWGLTVLVIGAVVVFAASLVAADSVRAQERHRGSDPHTSVVHLP